MNMPRVSPREGVTTHFHVAAGSTVKRWVLQILPCWTEPRGTESRGLRLCVRDESGRIILCLDGFCTKGEPTPLAHVFGVPNPLPLQVSRSTAKTPSLYRSASAAIAALTDLNTINGLFSGGSNPFITRIYHKTDAQRLCERCFSDCIQPLGDAGSPRKFKKKT